MLIEASNILPLRRRSPAEQKRRTSGDNRHTQRVNPRREAGVVQNQDQPESKDEGQINRYA